MAKFGEAVEVFLFPIEDVSYVPTSLEESEGVEEWRWSGVDAQGGLKWRA